MLKIVAIPKTNSLYTCSGMIIAAIRYIIIQVVVHPNNTNSNRIMVGSIFKYSPIPPHTPQSTLFVLDLYNLFGSICFSPLLFKIYGDIANSAINIHGFRTAFYLLGSS